MTILTFFRLSTSIIGKQVVTPKWPTQPPRPRLEWQTGTARSVLHRSVIQHVRGQNDLGQGCGKGLAHEGPSSPLSETREPTLSENWFGQTSIGITAKNPLPRSVGRMAPGSPVGAFSRVRAFLLVAPFQRQNARDPARRGQRSKTMRHYIFDLAFPWQSGCLPLHLCIEARQAAKLERLKACPSQALTSTLLLATRKVEKNGLR